MDIAEWLRGLGLERYAVAFRDNEIDWEALPKLTAEDLQDLGVVLGGHRRKLLEAIATLRGERQSLYWRSRRNLPRDFRRGRPAGAQVRSRCSKHGDSRATPGRPARSGQSTMPTSQ